MFEVVLYRHQNSYEKYILTCTPASYAYAVLHSEQRKNISATRYHKGDSVDESTRKVFYKEIDFASITHLQSLHIKD